MQFDVFNGDADGICALLQLRLMYPTETHLITGVKRDIALVQQVPIQIASQVTVLDISLDKNRLAVDQLLANDVPIFYADHHYSGEYLPKSLLFHALIDTQPNVCTSLLVDKYVQGQFYHWASVAAFGDNLNAVAEARCRFAGLSLAQSEALKRLGVCLNYNGYGSDLSDLHFHPAELYQQCLAYRNPLDLVRDNPTFWQQLHNGYAADMANGLALQPVLNTSTLRAVMLPDAPWARRVSGVLGNGLANQYPKQACVILTSNANDTYMVSIRAPLVQRSRADQLARRFVTGGGRSAAAGINELPSEHLDQFLAAASAFWVN